MSCASCILAAGVWASALSPQTVPQSPAGIPEAPLLRPETEPALRELMKKFNPQKANVCSIPLLEVPIPKNIERMPVLRPPDNLERMPQVKVPAPPCKEDKR